MFRFFVNHIEPKLKNPIIGVIPDTNTKIRKKRYKNIAFPPKVNLVKQKTLPKQGISYF